MYRSCLHVIAVLVALATLAAIMPQQGEAQRLRTNVSFNLGGDFSFGNRDQTNFSSRGAIARTDSLFESDTRFRFSYRTRINDEGESRVDRRSWTASTELSFRPGERWQPVVTGEIHSSFERRIALRYDTGVGMKVAHRDPDNPRNNRIDFSLTVLAERSYARARSTGGAVSDADEVSLTRWSGSLRVRRDFLGRFHIDTHNSYIPHFDSFGRFRVRSTTSVDYDLTDIFSVGVEFRANYDSYAKERGNDRYYDGFTQVSLGARF